MSASAQIPVPDASALRFLEGGGEMGRRLREHDWAATPLGPPHGWPQGLRTALRVLLNTGHPMYIFWGPQALCFYNDAYRRSIGDEMHPSCIGQPGAQVWTETWHSIAPQIEQVMSGGPPTWQENQLVLMRRHGVLDEVYWTYSYGPIDDDSSPTGIGGALVVCTETTEQVTMAAALARSQERLRLAMSAGRSIGTWDLDLLHDRVIGDEHFARLFGTDVAEAAAGVASDLLFDMVHSDDVGRLRECVAQAVQSGDRFSEEFRVVAPDGTVTWILSEGRCDAPQDGQPRRFSGIAIDISDRKAAEQKLMDLNAYLEQRVSERARERSRSWQLSPELLCVVDPGERIVTLNPAWQTTLGWSDSSLVGRNLFDLVHADDVDSARRSWLEAFRAGAPALRLEIRMRTEQGSHRWLSWIAVQEGESVYCSARDVTEDKEREEALRVAEGALRQSQKMEAVGNLTGGLAHDFNNLLTSIGASLDLVSNGLRDGDPAEIGQFVQMARHNVRRAAALTHRLLAFSRRQTLEPRPTDITRLVAGMEDLVRRTVGPAIRCEVVAQQQPWTTLVDASQMENALLNLCINARDAMPDGGTLSIAMSNCSLSARSALELDIEPGDYVCLAVTDSGVGMEPEVLAHAFDPFFTTKPQGKGTGLGLSMTYGFARQSGGRARIESKPGAGTTVSMYLPRHDAAPEGELAEAPASLQPQAVGDRVIVLIDDEPDIRMLLGLLLRRAGYTVHEAADSTAGLALLREHPRVDLLITDVGLPGGMNGRQVADAARADRPALKVMFVTGYAENTVLGNGHLEPGMTVVTKPFEIDALIIRIREILQD